MLFEDRIAHVRYVLDRREEILKEKVDRRFIVSIMVVSRRLEKVYPLREELEEIEWLYKQGEHEAYAKLENVEKEIFGQL